MIGAALTLLALAAIVALAFAALHDVGVFDGQQTTTPHYPRKRPDAYWWPGEGRKR